MPRLQDPALRAAARLRGWLEIGGGVLLVLVGVVATWWTYSDAAKAGGTYVVLYGPILVGLAAIARGTWRLLGHDPSASHEALASPSDRSAVGVSFGGYKSFVAFRYLLIAHSKVTRPTLILIAIAAMARLILWPLGAPIEPRMNWNDPIQIAAGASSLLLVVVVFWGVLRYSKPAMVIFLIGAITAVVAFTLEKLIARDLLWFLHLNSDQSRQALQVLGITFLVGLVIAGLATLFGSLRASFTFFTTVPIGGVWIGTAALVCVLSVMSGFETDLREKILGSNAHIQITRDDGDFVDWRDVKARIDKIPGVVASTPYAVSEVVIASNNNGMNVIIKGIDPATVGKVTDLISDLEDKDAIKRMQPLVDDSHDRSVPQTPRSPGTPVMDPPPDDMPGGGDPIDFSRGDRPDDAAGKPRSDDLFGGDAQRILDLDDPPPAKVTDPAPDDLITSDDPPVDYSTPGNVADSAIHVIDIPLEPTLSRRTQALPGVLVGRELVKQTHLYTGEEVRIVSPLSDPSNPDATGTPIPFNRDYRVAGVFYTGMYEYDLKYVYVTLDSLQDFLDRGDSVDGIEVRIEDADDTGRYVPTEAGPGVLREALGPGYRIVDWRELNRSLFSALKLEKIAMFLVLGIVILVASFSIVGNLIMVVIEKAKEIALLKTLGASNAGVMQVFAIQGLLIGMIGTVLGVATGLALCWGGKQFGLPLNPDVYYIDRLPIHVDPQSVLAAGLAGVLISIAATLYPALLAARVRPAAGMRH